MSTRSRLRLFVLQVLVVTVLATLLGRLWFLQVYSGEEYTKAAADNRIRSVVQPATRGMVYDSSGRVLIENRTAMVISVDRTQLRRAPDRGKDVLARLAGVVGIPAVEIGRQITPCGERYPDGTRSKAPDCWNGSPYQAIPVRSYSAEDPAQTRPVLAIEEHREDFPGVTAELQPIRFYPNGQMATHLLGYTGPIREDERKDPTYDGLPTAKVGRGGVEQVYDDALRGVAGTQQLLVDKDGSVTGVQSATEPQAGDALVLSLDRDVQLLAEKALEKGVLKARTITDPRRGVKYKALTGAVVVMEARTGRIAAMASYPSYDPTVFTKPLSPQTYQRLIDPARGAPLYSNATQGTFAPGSTFKIVSTAAAVMGGSPLNGFYSCPGGFRVGNRTFRNFEGETLGTINLRTTLIKSCDTVYYGLAYREWQRDGGLKNTGRAREVFPAMARAFGFGKATGIDLPQESPGSITSRATRIENYKKYKDDYCAGAKNPKFSAYRRQIDAENCVDGATYKAGEAALFAIGQGDVNVTPLQLAAAYGALANGGTLYTPRLAKALLSADGKRVTPIPPVVRGKLPVSPEVLDYIRSALGGVTQEGGTAQRSYRGFPHDVVAVAGKTGTADKQDQQPTSWFASFAPAASARFVVVAMVNQGGTGGTTAAPITREIWDGIYGLEGARRLLPRGTLPTSLPVVRVDGTVAPPGTKTGRPAAVVVRPSGAPRALGPFVPARRQELS